MRSMSSIWNAACAKVAAILLLAVAMPALLMADGIVNTGTTGRKVIPVDETFYVRTSGSDSNPCTQLAPCLTIQRVVNLLTEFDFAGNTITVDIGAGTFAGFGMKPMSEGILFFRGAGSANTILTNGPADGKFNSGEVLSDYFNPVCGIYLNAVDLQFTTNGPYALIGLFAPMTFDFGDPAVGTGTPSADIILDLSNAAGHNNQYLNAGAPMLINAGAGNYALKSQAFPGIYLLGLNNGAVFRDFGTWTITGSPNFQSLGYVNAAATAVYDGSGTSGPAPTYTGAATGLIAAAQTQGVVWAATNMTLPGTFGVSETNGGIVILGNTFPSYTNRAVKFAGLPSTPLQGMIYTITDSNTVTWAAPISGGGVSTVMGWYNGSNWTVVGQ